jgi:DNA modification methylase
VRRADLPDDLLPTEADPVRVVCGDALDVLRTLPDWCVDAVITDPPYGIAYATNYAVRGVGATWRGRRLESDDDTALRDAVLDFARARNLPWACFGSWKAPKPKGIRGVLIWDKGPAFGMGDLSFPWKASWEEIYIGGPGWFGHRGEGVLRGHIVVSWESGGRTHPTEKPVSLLRDIIQKLPSDYIVLDPFGGSGTTAIAALHEGRRCLIVEKDAGYCDIIRRRVAEAMGEACDRGKAGRQLSLFDAEDES